MMQAIKKFIRDEEGLTMVEYAVAGALITLACAAAFTNLGNEITNAINGMIGRMQG